MSPRDQAATDRTSSLRLLVRAAALPWQASTLASSAALGISVLTGAVPALTAWTLKLLIDSLTTGHPADSRRAVTLAVLGAVLGGLLLVSGYLTGYLSGVIQARVLGLAQRRLYQRIAQFRGMAQFERPDFLDRLQLAERSVESSPSGVTSFLVSAIRQSAGSITYVVLLLTVWPPIAILVVAVAVPAGYAQHRLARLAAGRYAGTAEKRRRRDYFRSLAVDPIAAKEARIFGTAPLFDRKMTDAFREFSEIELGQQRRITLAECYFALGGVLVAVVAAIVGVRGVLSGRLSIGDFTLFIAAVGGIQAAASSVTAQYGFASIFLRMFAHYLAIVDAPVDLLDGDRPAQPLSTGIEFRGVWFRYSGGPWVLRGVDLYIPSGSRIAIVGDNGAGKSTLVKLLMRFYDPDRGQILWDGVDIRTLSIESLRQRLSSTFQDFARYELSARESIGIGALTGTGELPDADRIRSAATLAGADDFLAGLPGGYDTMLSTRFTDAGEAGTTLSGGQWQRLAIARSLIRSDADVLVLDEPSSGIDAATEYELHQAISTHGARTQLIISHRLSSLRDADQIVLLDDGAILERGTHEELMSRPDSRYAELFRKQAAGYQLHTTAPLGADD